jgi:KTSC domain
MINNRQDNWNEHDSSHVVRSRYNSMDRTLDMEFTNGNVYRYHGVDQSTNKNFQEAKSQGEFLHRHIKGVHHAVQLK